MWYDNCVLVFVVGCDCVVWIFGGVYVVVLLCIGDYRSDYFDWSCIVWFFDVVVCCDGR